VFTDASLPAAAFNGAQLVDANFDGATLFKTPSTGGERIGVRPALK
jgi:uncharacterized protein YjbI with pentapeptide repeats